MYDTSSLRRLINDAGLIKVFDGSEFIDLRKPLLDFLDHYQQQMTQHAVRVEEWLNERQTLADTISNLRSTLEMERHTVDELIVEYNRVYAALQGVDESGLAT